MTREEVAEPIVSYVAVVSRTSRVAKRQATLPSAKYHFALTILGILLTPMPLTQSNLAFEVLFLNGICLIKHAF